MLKLPNTKVTHHLSGDEVYVEGCDIVQVMKDDLLYILSNPDEDIFASEYLKERIEAWEQNLKAWEENAKNG